MHYKTLWCAATAIGPVSCTFCRAGGITDVGNGFDRYIGSEENPRVFIVGNMKGSWLVDAFIFEWHPLHYLMI